LEYAVKSNPAKPVVMTVHIEKACVKIPACGYTYFRFVRFAGDIFQYVVYIT
jgi:hypothetical protein